MENNIFLKGRKKFTLSDYMNFDKDGRSNPCVVGLLSQ